MNRKEFGRSLPLSRNETVPDFAGATWEKHEEEYEI
jgi:hypothetical protein